MATKARPGARVACQSSPRISTWPEGASGRKGGTGGRELAEHRLRAEQELVAPRKQGDPGEAKGDAAERDAGRDRRGEMDAHLGDGSVDQGGEAEDQRDDAGKGDDAVAGRL